MVVGRNPITRELALIVDFFITVTAIIIIIARTVAQRWMVLLMLYKANLTVRRGDSKISFTFNQLLNADSEDDVIQMCREIFPVSKFALKINGVEEYE